MRKIHDIELDGHTGPDGKFHATGVSLVENSGNPHTGIFVDYGTRHPIGSMLGPSAREEQWGPMESKPPEGDMTVITVTLRPAEVLKGMRQRQDPEQLVLLKLKEAGAPVQGTVLLSLKTGYLTRCDHLDNTITFEWRSK